MRLYLVQHGEACGKDVDPARPLTELGRDDADRLAAFLQSAGVRVERVIHSGKLRALQTAERLAQVIAPGVSLTVSNHINPNDDPRAFDWLGSSAEPDTLIVGHLPFMARFVSLLVTGDAERPLTAYQPGSVVCLEPNDGGRWRISWMIRPELLKNR